MEATILQDIATERELALVCIGFIGVFIGFCIATMSSKF